MVLYKTKSAAKKHRRGRNHRQGCEAGEGEEACSMGVQEEGELSHV